MTGANRFHGLNISGNSGPVTLGSVGAGAAVGTDASAVTQVAAFSQGAAAPGAGMRAKAGAIFVSYRRDDGRWSAGRINDCLASAFGREAVFFDTATIQPGEDFHKVLGDRLAEARVRLAVIGPGWLDRLEQRLGDANDFVRIEIGAGLARGIVVVPVLIDGASPPPEYRLPEALKQLARRNAIEMRGDRFAADSGELIRFLTDILTDEANSAPAGDRGRLGAVLADVETLRLYYAPDPAMSGLTDSLSELGALLQQGSPDRARIRGLAHDLGAAMCGHPGWSEFFQALARQMSGVNTAP